MKSQKRVTMQDIAKAMGVDQSTVSLALRDSGKISEATRERVKLKAENMGYHPNPLVSALMQNRKSRTRERDLPTLAYLSFEAMSETIRQQAIFAEFERGARDEAERQGFKIEKLNVTPDMSIARIDQIIVARGIRGVIISALPSLRSFIDLSWENFSSIAIGPTLRNPKLHRVMSDHYDNMKILLDHAIERGFRKVGLCIGQSSDDRTEGRWEACFLRYQEESNLQRVPVGKLRNEEQAEADFCAWYAKTKPDLIIGVRVHRIIRWLENINMTVPKDVSIATVADAEKGGNVSGIVEDGKAIGSQAVSQLIRLIFANQRGLPEHPIKILIPSTVNYGSTMH